MIRLSSKRALLLYALVVAFAFVAFVLGLMVGTGSVERVELSAVQPSYEPAADLETQLEFYDELSKPIEDAKRVDPVVVVENTSQPDSETDVVTEKRSSSVDKSGPKQFTIQVAAHSTRGEAEHLLSRLRTKSFEGTIREPDTSAGDKYYRVWVGEFSTSEEAETYATQLKEEGFHTYIRKMH